MARDYKKIKAWQKADALVKLIYSATRHFPKDERFGLTSQLRRAAVSVAANIVEGASRQHKKDYLHFLYMAKGSLSEVEYLLSLSKDLGFMVSKYYSEANAICQETAATLYGLVQSVESKL